MTFEAVYIMKGDDEDQEVLGQVSYDSKTDKWFFMPKGKLLFMEEIDKISAKLHEVCLANEQAKPTVFDMFKKRGEKDV